MPVSDWGSGVCSSDLAPRVVIIGDVLGTGVESDQHQVVLARGAVGHHDALAVELLRDRTRPGHRFAVLREQEHGRASSRESVCQYVQIPGVCGSLKKKIGNAVKITYSTIQSRY